jgi:hypothetical protein
VRNLLQLADSQLERLDHLVARRYHCLEGGNVVGQWHGRRRHEGEHSCFASSARSGKSRIIRP